MGDYKKLDVWKLAYDLTLAIYRATAGFPAHERYGLQSQLRRSAVSIVSNIAEGVGRHHDGLLVQSLRIARGSTSELECQLMLSQDLSYLEHSDADPLIKAADRVSRLLLGLLRRFEKVRP